MAKTAERILLAEAVLVGGLALAVLIKEFPGLLREIRIWRMVNLGNGACPRH